MSQQYQLAGRWVTKEPQVARLSVMVDQRGADDQAKEAAKVCSAWFQASMRSKRMLKRADGKTRATNCLEANTPS